MNDCKIFFNNDSFGILLFNVDTWENMLGNPRKPLPLVTGISPKEGPPGTRVTIRGENLGIDVKDLIGKSTLRIQASKY